MFFTFLGNHKFDFINNTFKTFAWGGADAQVKNNQF